MKIFRTLLALWILLFLIGCYEFEKANKQEKIQQTLECLDLDKSRIGISSNIFETIFLLESDEEESSKHQRLLETIDLIIREQERIANCTNDISSFVRLEIWKYGAENYESDLIAIKYMLEAFIFDEKVITTQTSLSFVKEQAEKLKNPETPQIE